MWLGGRFRVTAPNGLANLVDRPGLAGADHARGEIDERGDLRPDRLQRRSVGARIPGRLEPMILTVLSVRFNITVMRETLTISLPPRTKRLIARAASESGLTTSEYVRMAIHRKLWQDAVAESRRVAVPRARAKGVFTDEDVFALIS